MSSYLPCAPDHQQHRPAARFARSLSAAPVPTASPAQPDSRLPRRAAALAQSVGKVVSRRIRVRNYQPPHHDTTAAASSNHKQQSLSTSTSHSSASTKTRSRAGTAR